MVPPKHRIVILGAGPIGMRFAIELKKIYGTSVQIILVEKRVSDSGLPLPFTRKWPINIQVDSLDGICGVSITDSGSVGSGVSFCLGLCMI